MANPELCIPELEGKTSKMYRCVALYAGVDGGPSLVTDSCGTSEAAARSASRSTSRRCGRRTCRASASPTRSHSEYALLCELLRSTRVLMWLFGLVGAVARGRGARPRRAWSYHPGLNPPAGLNPSAVVFCRKQSSTPWALVQLTIQSLGKPQYPSICFYSLVNTLLLTKVGLYPATLTT